MKTWLTIGTLLLSLPLIPAPKDMAKTLDPSNGLGSMPFKEKSVRSTAEGTGATKKGKKKPGSIMNPGGKLGGENGWQGL